MPRKALAKFLGRLADGVDGDGGETADGGIGVEIGRLMPAQRGQHRSAITTTPQKHENEDDKGCCGDGDADESFVERHGQARRVGRKVGEERHCSEDIA